MRYGKVMVGIIVLLALFASGTVLGVTQWGVYQGYPVVRVVVDGTPVEFDVPAINLNGRTMVPLRFVSEVLGAVVSWEESTWTAVVDSLSQADAERLARLEWLLALWTPPGSGVSSNPDTLPAGPYSIRIQGWNLGLEYDRLAIAAVPEGYFSMPDGTPVARGMHEFTTDTTLLVNLPGMALPPINFSMYVGNFILAEVDAVDGCFTSLQGGIFEESGRFELWIVPPLSLLNSVQPTAFKVAARMATISVTMPEFPSFSLDTAVIEEGEGWSWSPGSTPFGYEPLWVHGYGFNQNERVSIDVYPEGQPESRLSLMSTLADSHGVVGGGVFPSKFKDLPPGRYVVEARQDGRGAVSAALSIIPRTPIQVDAVMVNTPAGTAVHVTGSGFWPSSPVIVHFALLPTSPGEGHSWMVSANPTQNGFLDLTIKDVLKYGPITGLIGIEQAGRTPVEVMVKNQ
jgi:hypothetical protein